MHLPSDNFQARFHQRWQHLRDPDVRALAWLLDAPGLLDPAAPQWQGQIASLGLHAADEAADWLLELDREPTQLRAALALQPRTRLGRYAEKLMAYYFAHQGVLVANGLQVRAGKNDTIGEFDFLLRDGDGLVHWEFATKLYLLEASGRGTEADYFVGPNLADTLGLKMRKIFERQLALGEHPAAQAYLPQPIARAQALVKGWLFYHDDVAVSPHPPDVGAGHCRGFWCALSETGRFAADRYMILPRLRWLAPVQAALADTVDRATLTEALHMHFRQDSMPVLVALLRVEGDVAIECERGFVVPDGWSLRAEDRVRHMQRDGAAPL